MSLPADWAVGAAPLPPLEQWRPARSDWGQVRARSTTYLVAFPLIFWVFAVLLLTDDGATAAVVFFGLGLLFVAGLVWVRRLPARAERRVAAAVRAGRVEPVRARNAYHLESAYGVRRLWISLEHADGRVTDVRTPGAPKPFGNTLVVDEYPLHLVTARGGRFGALVDPVTPVLTRWLRGPVPLPRRKVPRRGGIRKHLDEQHPVREAGPPA